MAKKAKKRILLHLVHRWTDDELRELAQLRHSMTLDKLARRYRVSRSAIQGILRRIDDKKPEPRNV